MDAALDAVIVALKSIRDQADSVLRKIEQPRRERSLAWKCAACQHTKRFTRPALAEVAAHVQNVLERPLIPCDAVAVAPKNFRHVEELLFTATSKISRLICVE